jgi:hypothetical protein
VSEQRLASRGPHDAVPPVDLTVLRELAVHVGAAANRSCSPESLVAARAEERRRHWRDLHHGLSPSW